LKEYFNDKPLEVVGFEDGYFPPKLKEMRGYSTVLAAVLTENVEPKSVILDLIEIDGLDATEKAIQALLKLRENYRIDVILLGGITFAGFNIINPVEIYEIFRKPVIVVTEDEPSDEEVERALKKHFLDWKDRVTILRKFRKKSKIHRVRRVKGKLYIQPLGLNVEEAENIVLRLILKGKYPEPLRLAKTIASSLAKLIFHN